MKKHVALAIALCAVAPCAFATGEPTLDFSGFQTQLYSYIGTAVTIAIAIAGVMWSIPMAVRLVKRIAR